MVNNNPNWCNETELYPKRSILTNTQKTEIGMRRYNGEKSRDLAVEYGVRRGLIDTISKIEN